MILLTNVKNIRFTIYVDSKTLLEEYLSWNIETRKLKSKLLKKIIRYGLRIGGGIAALFLLLLIVVHVIITFKKESIRELAIKQINKQIVGDVTIGDLSPSLLRTFPNISVRLTDVVIRDSLYNAHHQEFLNAEKIYIRIQLLSLLSGKPKIGKVIVENGSIHLYTDECGYCNLNRNNDVAFKKGKGDIPDFTFKNTRIVIENEFLNSYHDIEAYYLDCDMKKRDTSLVLNIELNSLVHSIGFNMAKGSYLKGKSLSGDFRILFSKGERLELNNVELKIDKQPFDVNGAFYLNTDPKTYALHFQTKKVAFAKGVGLLTQTLQEKFDSLDIKELFDVGAKVSGQMAFRVVPAVIVDFKITDSELLTPLGQLYHSSFTGVYSNRIDTLLSPSDTNTKLIFNDVQAEFSEMAVTATHIEVNNLKQPYLICDLQSKFELSKLNELTESSTIRFSKGLGDLDITYSGPLLDTDTLNPNLNGTLTLNDAEINYIPRNLLFKNGFGVIEFKGEDLVIKKLLLTAGNTRLTMDGKVANLLALMDINPEKLMMEWNVSTPDLNLNDFMSYVAPISKAAIKQSTKSNKIIKATENLDRMLSDGTAKLTISADKMAYKKFVATKVAASVLLVGNQVIFDDTKLNHAGGTIVLDGSLTNGNTRNVLDMESSIMNVNIPDLFRAFDNFGQDAITSQNMKGQMTAKINMAGVITDKATVLEKSMKGSVDFSIKNGELINFEPAVNIAATAFKKRDFSHIQFGELRNRLEIDGSTITVNKMEIRSNVVILFVEGIYDTKEGSDMSIQVPLSNLSAVENESLKNTGRAGVNVRLRAKTGDDGKLKISWDPFNNAEKRRKEEKKSDSAESKDK